MARQPSRSRDERSSWERYGIISQIALAVASILTVLLSTTDRFYLGSISTLNIVLAVLSILYIGAAIAAFRYLRRVKHYDFRLATTGRPNAGKSVLSILLYEHLMNSRTSFAQFTADSRSAISTYQAIRNLTAETWPASTSAGSVIQYDGEIVYKPRRATVNFEIGDVAGQHWVALADAPREEPAYLDWVISANGLVHVIPANAFETTDSMSGLLEDINDLRLATRLIRSTRKGRGRPNPLLVAITKIDLIPGWEQHDCMRLFTLSQIVELPTFRKLAAYSSAPYKQLMQLEEELSANFESILFMFATYKIVTSPMYSESAQSDDLASWILSSARGSATSLSG